MSLLILRIEEIQKEKIHEITIPFQDFELLLIQYNILLESYNKCHEENIIAEWHEDKLEETLDKCMDYYINKREELYGGA